MKPNDVKIGDRFGRIIIQSNPYWDKNKRRTYAIGRCDCGKQKPFRLESVVIGRSLSCGCLQPLFMKNLLRIHSFSSVEANRMQKKVYRAWTAMKSRCYNTKCNSYKNYGARGITVAESWLGGFQAFLDSMGLPPSFRHTLERINSDGNYEPKNCKWATYRDQQANKRTTVLIEFNGKKKCRKHWSIETGIPDNVIKYRLDRGWSIEKALTTQPKHYNISCQQ